MYNGWSLYLTNTTSVLLKYDTQSSGRASYYVIKMKQASGRHFILLSLCSCLKWTSSYAQLSISVDPPEPSIGDNVKITCNIISFSTGTASWFFDGSSVSLTSCGKTGYCTTTSDGSFTFSSNTVSIIVEIMGFASSHDSKTWTCQYGVLYAHKVIKAKSTPSTSTPSTYLLLLLLLLLLLVIPIFIILICCGCLDCCKCCRIFDHYDGKECCTVTCYCSKKGCCSFFYCTPDSKMGKCFGGHENEMERCGGCRSCRKKCRCGWPDFCTSKKMRSCGSCYCSCCVEEVVGKGLDETSVAMTGTPALYTETKNKVHPLATKLPPVRGVTSGETVELKEPRKKKKKKNKDKLDQE